MYINQPLNKLRQRMARKKRFKPLDKRSIKRLKHKHKSIYG
jgi:hypothetical protein